MAKLISFENLMFTDTYMKTSTSIIDTFGISSSNDISLQFINLTFTNIEYATVGNLMNLGHLLNAQVLIQGATFTNLTSAGIEVGGISSQNSLRSKVKIIDSKFSDYSSSSHSFIWTYSGSELEIRN